MLLRDDRRQDQDQMLQVLDGIQGARAKDSKRLSDAVPELLEAHHVRHCLGRFKHPASPKVGPGSSAGIRRPGACGSQGRRRNLLTPAATKQRWRPCVGADRIGSATGSYWPRTQGGGGGKQKGRGLRSVASGLPVHAGGIFFAFCSARYADAAPRADAFGAGPKIWRSSAAPAFFQGPEGCYSLPKAPGFRRPGVQRPQRPRSSKGPSQQWQLGFG
jgi:hypothetical protein